MSDAAVFRPRRRIEQRHPTTGHLIGYFETSLTDEELAEQNRAMVARREAAAASALAVTLASRQRAQAEREALTGVDADPEARAHLREAHQVLAAARDELARRREVMAGAGAHVDRCQAAYDEACRAVDGLTAGAVDTIVQQLEQGQAALVRHGASRKAGSQAEAAKLDLVHAEAAWDTVAVLVERAEAAVTEAEAGVWEAARGVVKLRASVLQAEINQLEQQLADRRARIDRLRPVFDTRPWQVPWPANAAALLTDPEASLDDGEAAPETVAA